MQGQRKKHSSEKTITNKRICKSDMNFSSALSFFVFSVQIRVAHYIMMIKLFAHFYNRRVLFKMNDDCEPFLLIALKSNIHHHTCLFLAQKLTKEISKANLI